MRARISTPVPLLRMFEAAAAYDFYLDYLGFEVLWEHRFEPDLPLYARIRRDAATIDLTEHHGDGTPGSVVYVRVRGLVAYHRELAAKNYGYLRPGLERGHEGDDSLALTVTDPFGNSLRFAEKDPAQP